VYSLVKDVLDIKKDITAVQEPADDPAEVRRKRPVPAISNGMICQYDVSVSLPGYTPHASSHDNRLQLSGDPPTPPLPDMLWRT